jgi:DNA-binding response OmpR family regulator
MSKKILVVDDDLVLADLLEERLREHAYTVVVAHDTEQGVRFAHNEKPDIIILDIMMPAGGGIIAYENLKLFSDTKEIPIIFISAHDTNELKQKLFDMGAKDFITKPFKIEVILEKIEAVLKG